MERKTYIISAEGKVLGRLASNIAVILRGKQKPDFEPYKDIGDFVVVKNISKIKLTGKKAQKKVYYRHSGYMGGLKKTKIRKLLEENPREVLKKAVFGMLCKNKLRDKQIRRLKIEL